MFFIYACAIFIYSILTRKVIPAMKWKERGVKASSSIYFFRPIETAEHGNYHITCIGDFQCNDTYCVHRKGNYTPLLMYIREGEMRVVTKGREYLAHSNQIVLLDCLTEHRYEAVGYCSFVFFHFNGNGLIETIGRLTRINGGPIFIFADNEWFDLYISLLVVKLMNAAGSMDEFEISGAAYTMIAKLEALVSPSKHVEHATTQLVAQAQEYIRTHLMQNISREELASQLNISTDYLSHIFRREVGCSPIEYHARQRIEYAKSIILYSGASITEIADLLGFSSSASFVNAFKSRCGISPLQFRKNYLLNMQASNI